MPRLVLYPVVWGTGAAGAGEWVRVVGEDDGWTRVAGTAATWSSCVTGASTTWTRVKADA